MECIECCIFARCTFSHLRACKREQVSGQASVRVQLGALSGGSCDFAAESMQLEGLPSSEALSLETQLTASICALNLSWLVYHIAHHG